MPRRKTTAAPSDPLGDLIALLRDDLAPSPAILQVVRKTITDHTQERSDPERVGELRTLFEERLAAALKRAGKRAPASLLDVSRLWFNDCKREGRIAGDPTSPVEMLARSIADSEVDYSHLPFPIKESQ